MRKSANPHFKLSRKSKRHPRNIFVLRTSFFWQYRFSEQEAVSQDLFSDEADGDDGGACFYGKECGSFYGCGFSAEEGDEDVVGWGVLVGDDTDICAAPQKSEQLLNGAVLRNCLEPQSSAQAADIALKEGIVKRTRHGIEGGSQERQKGAREVPVSKMRGDKYSRTPAGEVAADSIKIFSGKERQEALLPYSADVLHLKKRCDKMLVKAFDDFGISGFRNFGTYGGEVVEGDTAMSSVGDAD